ncbi:hypothetical protein DID75_00320 [Candidatus Marinamargulisbacteria bacterium SCGC AG-410-N11]|nr:hypothetical protein DID75_00320 [Candidatus Marinamargulisbacteria bacterium SCGC AG-410-N11]
MTKIKNIIFYSDISSVLSQKRALAIQSLGYNVFCISPKPEKDIPNLTIHSLNVKQYPPIFRECIFIIFFIFYFIRIKPKFIHIHWAAIGLQSFLLMYLAPLVVTVMGGDVLEDQGQLTFFRKWCLKRLLNKAKAVTVKSEFLAKEVEKYGVLKENIHVINWGIDFDLIDNISVNHITQSSRFKDQFILFSPRLCQPLYNIDKIVESYIVFEKQYPNSLLLISEFMADADYLRVLKKKVASSGLGKKVLFLGSIPWNDMIGYYKVSDCVVSIPNSDGFPQTIIEAMACGCFPIMGNLDQYSEHITHSNSGYLVDLEEETSLLAAFKWVYNLSKEKSEIVEKNMKYCKEIFDSKAQLGKLARIYNDIIN